jgi:hypothetical protein
VEAILPNFNAIVETHEQAISHVCEAVKIPSECLASVDLSQDFAIFGSHNLDKPAILPEKYIAIVGNFQTATVPSVSPLRMSTSTLWRKIRAHPQQFRQGASHTSLAVDVVMNLPNVNKKPLPPTLIVHIH